jgi:hypothetical protein
VARAKDLRGPWEKYEKNPLFGSNETWKCPGHGTPIEKDGRYYFLYHAYHAKGGVYAGRQGVLKEFRFTDDGWITLVNDTLQSVKPQKISDSFSGKDLSPEWQWSVFNPAKYKIGKGVIQLMANSVDSVSFLARKTLTEDYSSEVTLIRKASDAAGGLSIVGDEKNMISLIVEKDRVYILKFENDKKEILYETKILSSDRLTLKVNVLEGYKILFSYGNEIGKFNPVNKDAIDGTYLPPWDRALRVALVAKGEKGQKVVFDNFLLGDN